MPAGISAGAIAAGVTAAGSLASGISSMTGGAGGGSPSGYTTSLSQVSDPVLRDYLGRIQSGWNTGNLGNIQVPFSAETQQAMDTIRRLGGPGSASSTAIAHGIDTLGGLASGTNYGGTAYAPLYSWSKGDFSNSPGYSGLAATAGGAYLPSMIPGVTYGGGSPDLGAGGGVTSPGAIKVGGSGNPFLDNLINVAANKAQGAVNSSFNANNRFGGGSNANALTSNVMDATSGILSPIYQTERGRQLTAQQILGGAQGNAATTLGGVTMNAIGALPGLDTAQYIDPTALQSVGTVLDQRANIAANHDYYDLKNASTLLGAGTGGPTSNSSPYWTNPFAGILGSSMAGGGFGKLFGGSSPSDGSTPSTSLFQGIGNWSNGLNFDGMNPNVGGGANSSGYNFATQPM